MMLTEWHLPWPLAVAAIVGLAALLGAVHGLLITRLRLQPFVVTLCGLLVYRGLARFIADDETKGFGDAAGFRTLQHLMTGSLFGVPTPFVAMLRGEKSASGIKGIYTTLAGGPAAPAAVTVDAQGRIGNREPLTRSGGAMLRIQPPPPPPSPSAGGAPGVGRAAGPTPAFVSMFPPPASTTFKPNDWNTFEVLVDANVFRAGVNAPTGFSGQAVDADTGTFGPIALYVGGAVKCGSGISRSRICSSA